MQFTYLRIQNFKSIRDMEIKDIEAALILVGKNNTGKTSVLDAFSAVCGGYQVQERDFNERKQGVRIDASLSIGEEAPARVELLEDGWLAVTLEAVLPRRGDGDRSRFLAHSLRAAIRRAFPDRLPPKFHICVLAYEHIYGPGRRFLDHDNLELKHCQDVLEAAFLTNDTAALCSAFQCSHRREQDGTRIWILPPEQFPEWLKSHPECWKSATETMQE